jgi:hypothetical protein
MMPAYSPNYELAAVGAEEHIARLGRVSPRDGRVAQRTHVAAAVGDVDEMAVYGRC